MQCPDGPSAAQRRHQVDLDGVWAAPHGDGQEPCLNLIALQAELDDLKEVVAQAGETTGSGGGSGKARTKRTIADWQKVKPTEADKANGYKKKVNGKDVLFCTKHGYWCAHLAKECRTKGLTDQTESGERAQGDTAQQRLVQSYLGIVDAESESDRLLCTGHYSWSGPWQALVTKLQAWAMLRLVMATGVWVSVFKLEEPLLTSKHCIHYIPKSKRSIAVQDIRKQWTQSLSWATEALATSETGIQRWLRKTRDWGRNVQRHKLLQRVAAQPKYTRHQRANIRRWAKGLMAIHATIDGSHQAMAMLAQQAPSPEGQ